MQNDSQVLGILGEELAGQFLAQKGYKLLVKNFECALGEIDLIAKEKGALVFLEVKTRRSQFMGHPAEALTPHKRHQIRNCAQYYLKRYGITDVPCRFDVVSILWPEGARDGRTPEIELIQDAF